MAIDTAQKRASAVNVGSPWRGAAVVPGSMDQAERQAIAFSYAGVLAATVIITPIPYVDTFFAPGRRAAFVSGERDLTRTAPARGLTFVTDPTQSRGGN